VVFINPETQTHELDVDLRLLGVGEDTPLRIHSTREGKREARGPRLRLRLPARDMVLVEGAMEGDFF
jgi:hypothetical protein